MATSSSNDATYGPDLARASFCVRIRRSAFKHLEAATCAGLPSSCIRPLDVIASLAAVLRAATWLLNLLQTPV